MDSEEGCGDEAMAGSGEFSKVKVYGSSSWIVHLTTVRVAQSWKRAQE